MKTLFLTTALVMLGFSVHAQSGNWDGYYIGVNVGTSDLTVEDLDFGDGPIQMDGLTYGGFTGINIQKNALVFGFEAGFELGDLSGDDGENLQPFSNDFTMGIRGRLGLDAGGVLPYLSVGYVSAAFEADHEGNGLDADFGTGTANGFSYGAGVDIRMGTNNFLRLEFKTTDFSESPLSFYGDTDSHNIAASSQTISIGYGMSF